MLVEAIASVNKQTLVPSEHLITIDYDRVGQQTLQTRMAERAQGEWLVMLDDDDTLDATYLERTAAECQDGDVVSTYCRTEDMTGEGRQFLQYNKPFDPDELLYGRNNISPCALVRRDLFLKIGGYRQSRTYDQILWQQLLGIGARFKVIPEELWVYRLHGSNYSWNEL